MQLSLQATHGGEVGVEVPTCSPDVHRRNIAKRAISTFKAHFLTILVGISDSFPN